MARKIGRVIQPSCHTRSTLERNFSAAASSRNPMNALTETSHEPDFGNLAKYCGNTASKKNGAAKEVLNASIPTMGKTRSPLAADASSVPTTGTVQVNEVSVKVNPISSGPARPPRRVPE